MVDEAHSQSFSLKGYMLEEVRALARKRGESMSFIVREALRQYLEQQRRAQSPPERTQTEPSPGAHTQSQGA